MVDLVAGQRRNGMQIDEVLPWPQVGLAPILHSRLDMRKWEKINKSYILKQFGNGQNSSQ